MLAHGRQHPQGKRRDEDKGLDAARPEPAVDFGKGVQVFRAGGLLVRPGPVKGLDAVADLAERVAELIVEGALLSCNFSSIVPGSVRSEAVIGLLGHDAVTSGSEPLPQGSQQGSGQLRKGNFAVQQPAPGLFQALKAVIVGTAGGRRFFKGVGLPLGHEPPEIQPQNHGLRLVEAQHGVQGGTQRRQIPRHAAHIQKGPAEIGGAELHDPRGAHGRDVRPDGRIEL